MNLLTIGYSSAIIDEFKKQFEFCYSISTSSNADMKWWDVHNFTMNTDSRSDVLEAAEIKELIRHFEMYSDMNTRRYAVVHGQHSETKNLLMLQASYASSLLNKYEIDLIFFENMPHEGFDFIFYILAKLRGIRTIITNQTQFSKFFWIIENYEDYGAFYGPKINSQTNVDITLPTEWFYVPKKITRKKSHPFLNLIKSTIYMPHKLPVHLLNYFYTQQFNRSAQPTIEKLDDVSEPYIYYPLHMQPEMNVTALAGTEGLYSDQIFLLETLRRRLPSYVKIFIKENPKQTYRCRDQYFFKRLNAIHNLEIVPQDFDSRELIRRSIGVATLTGTVGWEALCLGKPCLIFGNAWYSSLTGVQKFNDHLDLELWLKQIPTSFEVIEKEMHDLLKRCGTGVVDTDYIAIVKDFNSQDNAVDVVHSLKRYIAKCH